MPKSEVSISLESRAQRELKKLQQEGRTDLLESLAHQGEAIYIELRGHPLDKEEPQRTRRYQIGALVLQIMTKEKECLPGGN